MEDVSKEVRLGERTTNKSSGYQIRYQGSIRVISRVETLKGASKEPRSSSNVSTTRKGGATVESKVGSNNSRVNRNKG